MFKFNELFQIHLEITNNCQASCPMCNRNINGGLENPLIIIQNWTLEEFKTIMNREVLDQIFSYYYCGNYGDPILNNDLIDMCRYTTEYAPQVKVTIHTNGSARNTDWWIDLAKSMPHNHTVAFALDGLEDTHSIYRIGTDFNKVIDNATAFIQAGGNAEWVFIKFKHNQHQIDDARIMSVKLGFKSFVLKNSSRFILESKVKVVNRDGNLTHYIEPATETPLKFIDKKIIRAYKEIVAQSKISCKVQHDKEVYVDVYKNLYPCCWIASVPYTYIEQDESSEVRIEMQKQHYELMNSLGNTNTLVHTIQEIIDSIEYQTVWNEYWTTNKLITCARTCGMKMNFSQPHDQYV
jgi:hypothetical protein